MVFAEDSVDQFVREGGTVLSHSWPLEDNPVLDVAGQVLLPHAGLYIARGIADLQPALMGGISYVLIGVYHGDFANPLP